MATNLPSETRDTSVGVGGAWIPVRIVKGDSDDTFRAFLKDYNEAYADFNGAVLVVIEDDFVGLVPLTYGGMAAQAPNETV